MKKLSNLFKSRCVWLFLVGGSLSLGGGGCNADKEHGKNMNILYSESGHQISGGVSIGVDGKYFELNPPVKIANEVQYVTLSLPSANLWRSGSEKGSLVNAEDDVFIITIEAKSKSGKTYPFDSVSFGKDLMFSHLPVGTGNSGLPENEILMSVHIKSDPDLAVNAIGWLDITNK